MLTSGGYVATNSLAEIVTFHVEVWATNSPLDARFMVSSAQLEKASKHRTLVSSVSTDMQTNSPWATVLAPENMSR